MVGLGRELGDPMLGDARLGDTPDRPPQTCSRQFLSELFGGFPNLNTRVDDTVGSVESFSGSINNHGSRCPTYFLKV